MGAVKHSWEGRLVNRPTQRGNEKESSWPPDFGTGDKTPFHIDRETGTVKKGYPKRTPKFGKAPAVFADSLNEPFYHHGACKMVDTRSGLRAADRDSGCVTTDRHEPADESPIRRRKEEVRKDLHEAFRKSVAQLENGTAPLTEEQRALCRRQNEIVAAARPGFDPFNAVGRVTDPAGRRYKKRKRSKVK